MIKKSTGDDWGLKCLNLVFSITKQFRNGDPLLDLFLSLHPDILPVNNNCNLKAIAQKSFSEEIMEPGPVPACFLPLWDACGFSQTHNVILYFG